MNFLYKMHAAEVCDTKIERDGGMKMLNYYISEFKTWLDITIPVIINEKNFLLIVGSLFLLGVVTKWIVMRNYGRLIRKAENINHTKNYTIRQIKTKYDSIRQVNGTVENPMLFVNRNLNKCRILHIPVNKLNNIINWCALLIMVVAAVLSFRLFNTSPTEINWIRYLVLGCFLAVALEMVNRMMPTGEKKMELSYVLVDVLVHGGHKRNLRESDSMAELASEQEKREKVVLAEREEEQIKTAEQKQKEEEAKEEEVLNQVIGEFLQ